MSGATYRIDVENGLFAVGFRFRATVVRLSDDATVNVFVGDSTDEVLALARRAVDRHEHGDSEGNWSMSIHVDDFGQDAEFHSVKV